MGSSKREGVVAVAVVAGEVGFFFVLPLPLSEIEEASTAAETASSDSASRVANQPEAQRREAKRAAAYCNGFRVFRSFACPRALAREREGREARASERERERTEKKKKERQGRKRASSFLSNLLEQMSRSFLSFSLSRLHPRPGLRCSEDPECVCSSLW